MKKLNLEEFLKYKQEIIDITNEYQELKTEILVENENLEEYEKNITKLEEKYKLLISELTSYNLENISYENWKDFPLINLENYTIDFSKTNANLDFDNIILANNVNINLKNCNLKNFNFEKNRYNPEMFDENFIENNIQWFLSDKVDSKIREDYYNKNLSFENYLDNIEIFKDKKVIENLSRKNKRYNEVLQFLGKDLEKISIEYKHLVKYLFWEKYPLNTFPKEAILGLNDEDLAYNIYEHEDGHFDDFDDEFDDEFENEFEDENLEEIEKTYEEKVKLIGENVLEYYTEYWNDYFISEILNPESTFTWSTFKELLKISDKILTRIRNKDLVKKYGVDIIEKSNIPASMFITNKFKETTIDELITYSKNGIEEKDLVNLVRGRVSNLMYSSFISSYTLEEVRNYGINNLDEDFSDEINNIYDIKKELEKRPIELIYISEYYQQEYVDFIKKYDIDNLIKLDQDTNGIISTYLEMFVETERKFFNNTEETLENQEKVFSYEETEYHMYELLKFSRSEKGAFLELYNHYPGYEFITGEFREKYSELFINEEMDPNIKNQLYLKKLKLGTIFENPEILPIIIKNNFIDSIDEKCCNKDKYDERNFAEYVITNYGEEELVNIILDYGKALNRTRLEFVENESIEQFRERIEKNIIYAIKNYYIPYNENMSLEFKEKYPELFIDENLDPKLKSKYYNRELVLDDLLENEELKKALKGKFFKIFYEKYNDEYSEINYNITKKLKNEEFLELAFKYGKYLGNIYSDTIKINQSFEQKDEAIEEAITDSILGIRETNINCSFKKDLPKFFKEKYPNKFLDDNSPEGLKKLYYEQNLMFWHLRDNPEWIEYLLGKDISIGIHNNYKKRENMLLNSPILDTDTLLKLGKRNPETYYKLEDKCEYDYDLEKSIYLGAGLFKKWIDLTGGKFIPDYRVIFNLPEGQEEDFLQNSKKWNKIIQTEIYKSREKDEHDEDIDIKEDIFRFAYTLGIFTDNDKNFTHIYKTLTDVPSVIEKEIYEEKIAELNLQLEEKKNDSSSGNHTYYIRKLEKRIEFLNQSYKLSEKSNKYVLNINKQKEKEKIKRIRRVLENIEFPGIINRRKLHQICTSFKLEKYNEDFSKFFIKNQDEIINDPEYIKYIGQIQRQFENIVNENPGRKITFEVAKNHVIRNEYSSTEIGNEMLEEFAGKAGYSDEDFEEIREIYNEGKTREFSSIPQIKGEIGKYSYETLRLDDPYAVTIGTFTDCCQEINGAGETSMIHSVTSPNGRIFCVRNSEGRLLTQSWVWRNQNVLCFDSIELPERIQKNYAKIHPNGKKGFIQDILNVYKKAANHFIQEDEKTYQKLLQEGTITKDEYDLLVLKKVTSGLGYNDIAKTIKNHPGLVKDDYNIEPKEYFDERLYIDSRNQYIYEDKGYDYHFHKLDNLLIYEDDIAQYDSTNIPNGIIKMIKNIKLNEEKLQDNLEELELDEEDSSYNKEDLENLTPSELAMHELSEEYNADMGKVKVMHTSNMALIYEKEEVEDIEENNQKEVITILDILTVPINHDLSEEEKEKLINRMNYQIKKALKQIGISSIEDVNIDNLSESKKEMIIQLINEIDEIKNDISTKEKENLDVDTDLDLGDERWER